MLSRKGWRMRYFSYIHSIIPYGIIFWGNTPNSIKILRIKEKRTILKKMDSCRELFKTMEILPFYSQCIFSLVLYVVNKKHLFTHNLEVHNHDTRSANNFHLPIIILTKYQNGAHLAGIKIFNHLPTHINYVANETQVFKSALKRFFFLIHFILMRNVLILIPNIYSTLLCFNVIINILLRNVCIIIVFCNLTPVIEQIHCLITLWLFPHP